MDDLFSKYRLSEALMQMYKLFWDEFSSWYLELVKPAYQQPIDRATYEATLSFFDSLLRLLHPFMPFITEELWQAIAPRKEGESIMVSLLPQSEKYDNQFLSDFEHTKHIIAGIRTIRLEKNIPNKDALSLEILGDHNSTYDSAISKMANLTAIAPVNEKAAGAASFMVGTTEFAVPLADNIDIEAELEKLRAELIYQEGFLKSVQKKLSNERFVQNAKPEIVENERKKQADAESKMASLKENIEALEGKQ
jgi:valyl-tRNA synthetase